VSRRLWSEKKHRSMVEVGVGGGGVRNTDAGPWGPLVMRRVCGTRGMVVEAGHGAACEKPAWLRTVSTIVVVLRRHRKEAECASM
jgi:hypothetical protein